MTAPVLEDLLGDNRLGRLFSMDDRHCALQLWILQIKHNDVVDNRIAYARLLPYTFSRDSWSGSDDDNFAVFGQHQVQIFRLSLYVRSALCAEIIRHLANGESIEKFSEALGLGISDNLKNRFGKTYLESVNLSFRPVAYLLNRDALELKSISSPHSSAGAFSASIVQSDKDKIFRLNSDYNHDLTKFAIDRLDEDTGLDFGRRDAVRFGDLELMIFPTLDDAEKNLLHVRWVNEASALVITFSPLQVSIYDTFKFRISIRNDDLVVYAAFDSGEQREDKIISCRFEVDQKIRSITDSTEIEIYGFQEGVSKEGVLCCRWRVFYIREIHLHGTAIGGRSSPVRFDWLEKTVRPASVGRAKAALTPNRGDLDFNSQVGNRGADPWVPAYRKIQSLFERLSPPKSEGKFLLRWGQGDPEARIELIEWFRKILAKHSQDQIVIFDPYFEDAGLRLLLLCAAPKADYIVFRSLPKPTREATDTPNDPEEAMRTGVDNLVAICENNKDLLGRFKLRIFGMRQGRLHDRYILIIAPDGIAISGFNLSNSFQKAAENFPLLITPIPQDVLLEVDRYKSKLVREASEIAGDKTDENSPMRLLFASSAVPRPSPRFESLRFLERTNSGSVLSMWTGSLKLRGLSGEALRNQLVDLGFMRDQSLALPELKGLNDIVESELKDPEGFVQTWEVLGELLAHSHAGDTLLENLDVSPEFLIFLTNFLEEAFNRSHSLGTREVTVVDVRFFRGELETLLKGPYKPEQLFHPTKYMSVSWSEFFSIRILWRHCPEKLTALAKTQMSNVPGEPQDSDIMRLSLLSQIVSEIALSIQFKMHKGQSDALIQSENGTLHWMGLNALEHALHTADGSTTPLQAIQGLPYQDQIGALGWMISRAARDSKRVDIYTALVAAVHAALPTNLTSTDLGMLVDSMRGHMRRLSWAEPWLYRDVVSPLIENMRINIDNACEIWMQEIVECLGEDQSHRGYFELHRDGQTFATAAYLMAWSSSGQRRSGARAMQSILKRQQRFLLQPLASTSNWKQWNDALTVSMQVLAFARWVQYYLQVRLMQDDQIDRLAKAAGELALIRPLEEWRTMGAHGRSELALFLEKADELLGSPPDEC